MKKSEEKRQTKLGLLFMVLLLAYMYSFFFFVFPILHKIYPSIVGVNTVNKGVLLIVAILLMTYTVKKWKWNLDDWGFTYNKTAWIVIFFALALWGYFWYAEGFPTNFGLDTVKQFLTGAWEELIFTVFFVIIIKKYFQTYYAMKTYKSKLLAVFITAIVFSLVHLPFGIWTFEEGLFNTASFVVYRFLYAFTGTFFFGLIAHGVTSNSQYMGLPLAVSFYAVITLLNWRVKKGSL